MQPKVAKYMSLFPNAMCLQSFSTTHVVDSIQFTQKSLVAGEHTKVHIWCGPWRSSTKKGVITEAKWIHVSREWNHNKENFEGLSKVRNTMWAWMDMDAALIIHKIAVKHVGLVPFE